MFFAPPPALGNVSSPFVLRSPAPRPDQRTTVEDVPEDDDASVRYLAPEPDLPLLPTGTDYESDSDDEDRISPDTISTTAPADLRDGVLRAAPTLAQASSALEDIRLLFRKRRAVRTDGYVYFDMNPFVRARLEGMKCMLNFYTNPLSKTHGHWGASSLQAAVSMERGQYCARLLRRMVRSYIDDRTILPVNPYGAWKTSMLCDQDLANDIALHLQELGTGISAQRLIDFLNRPETRAKHGISKPISLTTACRWLKLLGFRYRYEGHGQYTDGHERSDVVFYRNRVFIPALKKVSAPFPNH